MSAENRCRRISPLIRGTGVCRYAFASTTENQLVSDVRSRRDRGRSSDRTFGERRQLSLVQVVSECLGVSGSPRDRAAVQCGFASLDSPQGRSMAQSASEITRHEPTRKHACESEASLMRRARRRLLSLSNVKEVGAWPQRQGGLAQTPWPSTTNRYP
jgi:hypothetical protein